MKQRPKQYNDSGRKKASPIKSKEEVLANNDPHIDQDFPGFPHSPSQEKIIDPQDGKDKATAGLLPKKSAPGNKKKPAKNETLRGELAIRSSKKKRTH